VIVAMSASTDSQMNRLRFHGIDYAPTADYRLLRAAVDSAEAAGLTVHVGPVFSGDLFYNDRPDLVARTAEYGVLGIEMEASALYTLAAKFGRRALGIMTVSDHLITKEETTAAERQSTFSDMVTIALDAAESSGRPYDAAVALGCVIRGETGHYDIVAGESARALMDLSVARRLPLGNGILTVETEAQAWTRARVVELNKGGGAADAALALLRIKRHLAAQGT